MRGAQNNVNDIGKLSQNIGQSVEHILDSLVGRKQAEGEQHDLSFDAELIFEVGWIDESHVRNPMRDRIDLGRRRIVNILQYPTSPLGHDNQPGRERDQLLHDTPLVGARLTQNGVERRDNGHPQFAQERQNVTAGGSAENAELMLQADDVYVADVEEVRGTQVGRQVLLFNLEANDFGVFVTVFDVVDRDRKTPALRIPICDGGKQVGRERGDPAFARQVVADKGDLSYFGGSS